MRVTEDSAQISPPPRDLPDRTIPKWLSVTPTAGLSVTSTHFVFFMVLINISYLRYLFASSLSEWLPEAGALPILFAAVSPGPRTVWHTVNAESIFAKDSMPSCFRGSHGVSSTSFPSAPLSLIVLVPVPADNAHVMSPRVNMNS